jgi:hypothetical protein
MNTSDTKKKKKAKYILQDLDVREVSLVSSPAIGRTYLLTKSIDSEDVDMTSENDTTLLFNDEELEEYIDTNLESEFLEDVEKAATKREQGYDFPAAAFAYVPDSSKPSTWKLRLWETPQKKVTRRQVGMAVAALGKGFRGKKVQIPSGDLGKVKAKVRAAWRSVHDKGEEMPAVLKEEAGTVPADQGAKVMDEKLLELLKSVESEEIREALTGAFNTILTNKETVPDEIMKGFYELAGYEIPTIEKEVEKEVIKEVEKIVEIEKKAEPDEEEILKGLDEKTAAIFKEQKAKLEKAEADIKEAVEKAQAEEQSRIKQEYIKKASDNWNTLPFKAEDLGPVLKAVEEKLEKEESEVVMKVFETAKGALATSDQDEELGTAGGDTDVEKGSDPKYITKAKAMVEKGEAETVEQAVAKLVKTEPKLFWED